MAADADHAELLTVAEVARALGIAPRQVRRYAERLKPPERTEDRTCPLRVRLEAIERLRHAQNDMKDRGQDMSLLVSPPEAALLRELVAEKDRRIADLAANVEDLRRHNARLEGQVDDLRRLIPAYHDGQDTTDTAPAEAPGKRRPWWYLWGKRQ